MFIGENDCVTEQTLQHFSLENKTELSRFYHPINAEYQQPTTLITKTVEQNNKNYTLDDQA